MRRAATRVRNSLAYRMASVCRLAVSARPPRRLPPKAPSQWLVVTFAGPRQQLMLEQFLLSLYLAWPRLPRVRVITDGSDPSWIPTAPRWWPGNVAVLRWGDVTAFHSSRGHTDLLRFASRVPMARKLAGVTMAAGDEPLIYADTDVLWFRTLDEATLGNWVQSSPVMVISEDYQSSYDSALVPSHLPHLGAPPYSCAGFLFAFGDLLGACDLGPLMPYAAESGVAVTEQTIFAEMAHQLGARHWPSAEVYCHDRDRFSLRPTYQNKPWIARHYVAPARHLFWRDALALRLGVGLGAPKAVR
jgi:hypothetical protein